ncbi:MAG: hypothetical protein KGZ54_07155 [Dethiobacter sp.]|nr:hypothetical protein [Dethiobacter sp.]MBS3988860.1 hypothetical protein [Dethiobacter sp.]
MRARKRRDTDGALAWCMAGIPPELLHSFDLNSEWPENFSTMCAARLVAPGFIEIGLTAESRRRLKLSLR